jgi:Cytochrome c7 and related cytochrome c
MTTRYQLVSRLCLTAGFLYGAFQLPAQQQTTVGSTQPGKKQDFFIHDFHAKQLSLDCNTCHVPAQPGSVELKRPGHDQCMTCHSDAFGADLNRKICDQCHSEFPPTGADTLFPFPRYKKQRAILFEFAHARHVDPKGRIDAKTGFRADCTFCHKFDAQGIFATFPGHTQCTACHSQAGMKPSLTANSTTADCRGCHTPEEIENPGFTEDRRMIAPHVVSGVAVNLKFSHIAHFRNREQFNLNCTTCHYAVPTSTSLTNLTLPKMVDCVQCHDNNKSIAANFRMTNCQTCHVEERAGTAPASHTRFVKPDFHTENFRTHHETEASAAGAKCFVCHTAVQPAVAGGNQCAGCHQVMRPASHTIRWKDDIHGKYAAEDRASCALCHAAETCVRCHNELPRSHQPLSLFTGGAHAQLAMLNTRSCLTCHTYENTCSACHVRPTSAARIARP